MKKKKNKKEREREKERRINHTVREKRKRNAGVEMVVYQGTGDEEAHREGGTTWAAPPSSTIKNVA